MTGASMAVLATAAAIGTGYSIYAGEQGRAAQREAQRNAQAQALKQEKASEEAYNAAHRKQPNIPGAMTGAAAMGNQGAGSTMLTQGAMSMPGSPGGGSLLGGGIVGNAQTGKNTLLGQ